MAVGDENFCEIASLVSDGGIPLKKFKSKNSGLTICIAEAAGPLVLGYFCVATEAFDNDGLPHTLEHLIFMGSEKYPYKGMLDILANRCLASSTNAWTDTDHTCYTLSTAGTQGFLHLLPIYVDHLLYPLLTESAYITEVHHIDSDGEDAGVIYCEMQDKESTGERLCHFTMLDAMYPGNCAYKTVTSGLLKNFRESTNIEKVRAYHKEYYRPDNLTIFIVGQIEAADVFQSLQPVEERILKDEFRDPIVRPWQSPVDDLNESSTIEFTYPCEEEEVGMVIAAWRGPAAKDYTDILYLQILMEYLTDSSVSPLQKNFAENKDPYCSQVDFTIIENFISCIYIHFSNVPLVKLGPLKKRLMYLLERIASEGESLDMNRMKNVIQKRKLYLLSRMESHPHDQLAVSLIGDFLYGSTVKDLQQRVQQIPILDKLVGKTEEFWKNLLKQYMVDGHHVIVLGRPSVKLCERKANEEKLRLEKQENDLGAEGLKARETCLKEALRQNESPPPDSLINSVPVPLPNSIKFHSIKRYCNYKDNHYYGDTEELALLQLPCQLQLDVVNSNFVRMYALLNTSDIPQYMRMYIPLLVELMLVSPIQRDNELIPYHEVVRELADDTIFSSMTIGLDYNCFDCRNYAQVLCLSLIVEQVNYTKGVQWMKELLHKTVFDPPRIHTIVTRMLTDVSRMKRSGVKVVKTISRNLCFSNGSNHWTSSMIRQQAFLTELLKNLAKNKNEVVKALNELRDAITKVEAMTIHLAANIPVLKQKLVPVDAWKTTFFPDEQQPVQPRTQIKQCHELIKNFASESMRGAVVGVSSVETTFLLISAPCINLYTHSDYPALLMLNQYLTQSEGPMLQQLRGLGLAYTFDIFAHPNEGLIFFGLYLSNQIAKAYIESFKQIEGHLTKEIPWKTSLIETCRSNLVFETVEKEKTIASTVHQSVEAYYREIDLDFTKTLIEQLFQVTSSDMEKVGEKYLRPLFDPEFSTCVVCCHPSKVNEIAAAFKTMSRELAVFTSLENSFLKDY